MKQAISMEGIGARYISFWCNEDEDAVGQLCVIEDNDTVCVASNGALFCGVIVSLKDGIACVQVAGCCEAKTTGNPPALGWSKVAADQGKVDADENGRSVLVYHVDNAAHTVGMML